MHTGFISSKDGLCNPFTEIDVETTNKILLDSYDFTRVFNISGGFIAWESAGYSVVPEFSSIMLIATLIHIYSICGHSCHKKISTLSYLLYNQSLVD